MIRLPTIMVAPNGARRTRADHPALPVTMIEIVATALACHAAGAGAIHAHVRDHEGRHVLDAGLYGELIAELARAAPAMIVQITTEAAGRYCPAEQRAVVDAVAPVAVSVALREMVAGPHDEAAARRFYGACHDRDIAVQHILYEPAEVVRLGRLIAAGIIPGAGLSVLFVLGRYAAGQESDPTDLAGFLAAAAGLAVAADWMVCAFGRKETAALDAALKAGGKVRVGFENSLWHADGSLARDNAERVGAIAALCGSGAGLEKRAW